MNCLTKGAAILIPEFAFQRENRIRAAYYRKPVPG
jgi:hypothetical protein